MKNFRQIVILSLLCVYTLLLATPFLMSQEGEAKKAGEMVGEAGGVDYKLGTKGKSRRDYSGTVKLMLIPFIISTIIAGITLFLINKFLINTEKIPSMKPSHIYILNTGISISIWGICFAVTGFIIGMADSFYVVASSKNQMVNPILLAHGMRALIGTNVIGILISGLGVTITICAIVIHFMTKNKSQTHGV
jgi:hypothetical protein